MSIVGRLSTLQSIHYRRFHCIKFLSPFFLPSEEVTVQQMSLSLRPSLRIFKKLIFVPLMVVLDALMVLAKAVKGGGCPPFF